MRHRQLYSLYTVQKKGGKKIYYYRTYDDNGKRTSGKSTFQTSKDAARQYVDNLLSRGLLISGPEITFENYAKDWWVWDKCKYVNNIIATGGSISRDYADIARGYLTKYILPQFGKMKLSSIKARHIENWRIELREKHNLSIGTINNIYSILRKMLNEAERLDYITSNPIHKIKPFKKPKIQKGLLTPEEVRKVFDESYWNNRIHYAVNLLSASTGLRLGEALALQCGHVHESYIDVIYSLSRKYGLKETKTRSVRFVPMPSRVAEYLLEFKNKNIQGFVFSETGGKTPIYYRSVTDGLYKVLNEIGISENERKERNISFHSWRHFFNSLLRGKGIADTKIQKLTGHKTQAMVDHYTRFQIEDFEDVLKIQEEVFKRENG